MVGFGYVYIIGSGEDDVCDFGFVFVLFFDGFYCCFGCEFGNLDYYNVVMYIEGWFYVCGDVGVGF